MTDLGLVHVVYAPYGLPPFQKFVDSYRQHPAGTAHELILVCKAFETDALPENYRAALDGLPYHALFVPDGGFDLGSYFLAARACEYRFLCFLNSSSEILAAGWLANLRAALDEPGVGIAGATGSHESQSTNLRRHFQRASSARGLRRWVHLLRGRSLLFQTERVFAPFPNWHLRTNAFLIERKNLLMANPGPFLDKEDCHRFESGRNGLTAQLRRRGLQPRVVDRQGRAWLPAQWRESHTFRSGQQENLLVADNRTRDYAQADEPSRCLLTQFAWGGESDAI